MSSFSEQIAKLTIPDPNIDPEDDINEDTRARLVDKSLLDSDLDEPSSSRHVSKIRKSLALTVDDPKYKGKVVSRKDLDFDDDDSFSEDEVESNDGLDLDAGSNSDEELSDNDFNDTTANDSDGNYDDDDVEFEDDEEIDSDEAMGEAEDEPAIFRGKSEEASDKEKGKDTMNQISLWESILEARIKIQKLLGIANQLPRPSNFNAFIEQGGNDLSSSIKSATSSLTSLASVTFKLQEKLLSQVDQSSSENPEQDLETSKVYKVEKWNETIDKRCARLRQRRNKILKFWYDKTLISSGNRKKSFSSFERPTVDQIEQILSDRDRLIRRTRVQRTKYRVLGATLEENQEENNKDDHNSHLKETDEVFDDDDFYQQLLRQFIEQKTSQSQPESSDAMQNSILMTRNWLKLQHLTTKQKKIVDTKASKGRKVRYTIHPKLVSFMAPVDNSTWTHESRNQLVKTIFGKSLLSNEGES